MSLKDVGHTWDKMDDQDLDWFKGLSYLKRRGNGYYVVQRRLTYFTVRLTYCLTGLDSTKLVNHYLYVQHKHSGYICNYHSAILGSSPEHTIYLCLKMKKYQFREKGSRLHLLFVNKLWKMLLEKLKRSLSSRWSNQPIPRLKGKKDQQDSTFPTRWRFIKGL